MRLLLFISAIVIAASFVSCESNNKAKTDTSSKEQVDTASFEVENYCSAEIINENDHNNDGKTDKVCAGTYVALTKITTSNKTVAEKINRTIRENLEPHISEAKEKCTKAERCEGIELKERTETGCEVVTNKANILCIEFHYNYYENLGMTNNNDPQRWHQNFDLRSGNTIDLNDVLLPNSIEKITTIVQQEFIAANGNQEWGFTAENSETKFELGSFAIKKEGLLFTYNRYEMGYGALGIPNDVLIPYSKIQNLIDPNGLLGNFK